ncbi:MAG: hypothetical protein DRJ15_06295, partial [Bacteroidetes bacterium]
PEVSSSILDLATTKILHRRCGVFLLKADQQACLIGRTVKEKPYLSAARKGFVVSLPPIESAKLTKRC